MALAEARLQTGVAIHEKDHDTSGSGNAARDRGDVAFLRVRVVARTIASRGIAGVPVVVAIAGVRLVIRIVASITALALAGVTVVVIRMAGRVVVGDDQARDDGDNTGSGDSPAERASRELGADGIDASK